MMVDLPAPAHPATMNNVSNFFVELFVCSMMDKFLLMERVVVMAFDWLAMSPVERDYELHFT